MPTRTNGSHQLALQQGTLDLLILRLLGAGPMHGQGIARAVNEQSERVLVVDHGSLYPALQRLERRRAIAAVWGASANNRQARFYALTKIGRAEANRSAADWRRLVRAMARIIEGPRNAKR